MKDNLTRYFDTLETEKLEAARQDLEAYCSKSSGPNNTRQLFEIYKALREVQLERELARFESNHVDRN